MRPDGVNLIAAPPQIETLVAKIVEVLTAKKEQKLSENVNGWENIEAVLKIYENLLQK